MGRWRGRDSDDQHGSHELLTNFREMHARGELSDQEYRTIKTRLAAVIHAELKSADAGEALRNGGNPPQFTAIEEQLKSAGEDGAGK